MTPHPIASHRRSVQSVVLAADPWLFTQTREEGLPLLALHPNTDNDDYRIVTFLDEATRRQKEMIDAAQPLAKAFAAC